MRVIEFDGYGRPKVPGVVTGTVLLLVQGGRVSVVRLELVPPEKFGPHMHHALNEAEVSDDARQAVHAAHPECFASDRAWVLECPPEVAARARFKTE